MSKFSYFFFSNPTNKTVTGTVFTWGLLIANQLDQSLWSINQKYWVTVRSNLVHSFLEVHNCVVPFTSHGKLHEFGAQKPISWDKSANFDFFTINFTVWSHILSTIGDTLTYIVVTKCFIYLPTYLTLRSVSSLNNPQNKEIKFCENMKLTFLKSL
jgi:hypothetical protein